MFARAALLLLLLNVLAIESSKLHDSLKQVGKRWSVQWMHTDWKIHQEFKKRADRKKWENLSDNRVEEIKNQTTQRLASLIVAASSTENSEFAMSLEALSSYTDPDMTAQVCGDERTLNSYQYFKLLRSSATQYPKTTQNQMWLWHVFSNSKEDLHALVRFNLTDKNGIHTEMTYDFALKAKVDGTTDTGIFFITKVMQGGSCLEHGTFAYSSSHDDEDVEKLQEHPDARTFLNLFTPRVFKTPNDEQVAEDVVLPNNLPSDWLLGLSPEAKLTVCHEKDATDYTKEQFLSWYQRFGQMWHLKKADDEAMQLQVMELKDGVLVARVTFKVQIGVEEAASEHDWNFKISAKMNDDKTWLITNVDVLCVPTINQLTIRDEHYTVYRDVLGNTFDLYVNDRKQWYPATDFLNHFTKHNEKIQFRSCKDDYSDVDEIPKQFWVLDRYWNATMIGYFVIDDLEPLPAAEETKLRLRVKMQPPMEAPAPGELFGADWTFHMKWDKMDQFYYIHKVDFSCPKFMSPENGKFIFLGRHKGIGGTKK